ncbi:sugar-transfer associated ATP-grasp domain-containing protein [Microbacterium gorillae]|uniref:sugar-transfer associated ATP-grasp domain-containing protein n=1 Tax=Microbacterium gorillae TaxID=1231063 RepID=UPI00058EE5F7|nr:sugar-transfer associated ATP-grasp domain-containing protein [Microbacterium gorillae]
MQIDVKARARYFANRIARFNPKRIWDLASKIGKEHKRHTLPVFVDMLWWAAFHDTAFIDYYEADFASLKPAERKTFMTSLIQHHIALKVNDREAAETFASKITFNKTFERFLGREWLDLSASDAAGLQAFAAKHPTIIAKVPISREGHGVFRYDTTEITDWQRFYDELVGGGQLLVEEQIVQHPYLAEYCAGTVNTTRITSFFDGEKVHLLVRVQKFGRGSVSDQFSWGGFFTMLDENGHSVGRGHQGKNDTFYEVHPESKKSIVDFQVPLWDQVVALIDEVARVIPEVPYIGWDVAVGPNGPLLIEGNWIPGLYETRVLATGIRTGSRPAHEAVMSW